MVFQSYPYVTCLVLMVLVLVGFNTLLLTSEYEHSDWMDPKLVFIRNLNQLTMLLGFNKSSWFITSPTLPNLLQFGYKHSERPRINLVFYFMAVWIVLPIYDAHKFQPFQPTTPNHMRLYGSVLPLVTKLFSKIGGYDPISILRQLYCTFTTKSTLSTVSIFKRLEVLLLLLVPIWFPIFSGYRIVSMCDVDVPSINILQFYPNTILPTYTPCIKRLIDYGTALGHKMSPIFSGYVIVPMRIIDTLILTTLQF